MSRRQGRGKEAALWRVPRLRSALVWQVDSRRSAGCCEGAMCPRRLPNGQGCSHATKGLTCRGTGARWAGRKCCGGGCAVSGHDAIRGPEWPVADAVATREALCVRVLLIRTPTPTMPCGKTAEGMYSKDFLLPPFEEPSVLALSETAICLVLQLLDGPRLEDDVLPPASWRAGRAALRGTAKIGGGPRRPSPRGMPLFLDDVSNISCLLSVRLLWVLV
jgi:hypothetical protein